MLMLNLQLINPYIKYMIFICKMRKAFILPFEIYEINNRQ